jgi:hypothetical protein
MKNLKFALSAFLLSGALLLPALAQDESEAKAPEDTAVQTDTTPAKTKTAKKKPAKKKKIKKQPPREPESEYKFKAADTPVTYKFDKLSNPIIKAKPKPKASAKKSKAGKNAAAKDAGGTTGRPAPKLKKTPGFNEEPPATDSGINGQTNPEEGQ